MRLRLRIIGIVCFAALPLAACKRSGPESAPPVSQAEPTHSEKPAVAQPAPSRRDDGLGDWLRDVAAIANADAGTGRRIAIQHRLDRLGLRWNTASFDAGPRQGNNVLADVSGAPDAPLLLLGAHFDQVDVGEGATDNASGCATVLALAERFHRVPLQRQRVAAAFWDLEEEGLLGAKAYLRQHRPPPALYVNFDVFGWGDTVWMMAPDSAHPLAAASAQTAHAAGLKLALATRSQYPPTDHVPFLDAKQSAVSYSLIGGEEIPGIIATHSGKASGRPPKVFEVIHSSRDTLAEIDAAAAVRGVDAIEQAIRRWDAQTP